jgi:hypothetical protein
MLTKMRRFHSTEIFPKLRTHCENAGWGTRRTCRGSLRAGFSPSQNDPLRFSFCFGRNDSFSVISG